jgi:hypothetical protein
VEGGVTVTTRAVSLLLRGASLFATALAVITGLLGMHVLTSGHTSHGTASHAPLSQGGMAPGLAPPAAPAGHTGVAHPADPDYVRHMPAAAADLPAFDPAVCGASCPGAQESGAPCIPTAPGGPATIAPPQATQATVPLLPAAGNDGSAYGYLPPGPTPCDLSISRT